MSRKFLVTIILILFLLPFVSWYYLQSGLNWRKAAQEVMHGTTPFPAVKYDNGNGLKFSNELLEEHVSIVCFIPCNNGDDQMNVLDELYEQFKETNKANFILLDSCQTDASGAGDVVKKNWYRIPCSDSLALCASLLNEWPKGKTFALVDRNKVIRSYYGIATKDEKRILVEHMALLLPRERQEKVELKRGDKK
ncbi:MAG: hypothetical protein KBA14_00085 [Saprospiraceae bacterium]|nr:hypothetical protein [Saprospiraceae bacterium]